MPVKEDLVTEPGNSGEFTAVPEDIYQVVIKDIIEKDVPVFGKTDGSMEVKYLIKYIILDEGDQQLQMVTDFAPPKWFGGNTKKKFSPSKLVTIFKAIYGFYYPKLNVNDLSKPGPAVINDLIGKQVRVTVKVAENKNFNKITDYTVIKAELPVPEGVKIEAVKDAKPAELKPAEELEAQRAVEAEEAEEAEAEGEETEEDIDKKLPWEEDESGEEKSGE